MTFQKGSYDSVHFNASSGKNISTEVVLSSGSRYLAIKCKIF